MSAKSRRETSFPIHCLVWHNEFGKLDQELATNKEELERKDPRGRTPLHLSVSLGHLESTRVLLNHGADASAENGQNWTVLHEATATGDPELLRIVLQYRDYQRHTRRTACTPEALQRLNDAPDFYVEMTWEFTSWVPLVSRVCPSDTYRVYKSGASVRIDTTLLGFDQMNWMRGSRSYVFKGEADRATVMEVDHDLEQVYSEQMEILTPPPDVGMMRPSERMIAARLTSPVMTTFLDTEKIAFERAKAGIWGWRSDKEENINSYPAKVFTANNVELLTKSRVEHMSETDKKQASSRTLKTPIHSFLGLAELEEAAAGKTVNGETTTTTDCYNPSHISPEEYFNDKLDLGSRDIGRPKEQTTKSQRFKASLWLCEKYPLDLQEQVLPIIDLMATSNAHFAKLRDFITLQLPSGFPIKIEIPLFHVLNARVTFGNINASEEAVPNVTMLSEADGTVHCNVDESVFDVPANYLRLGQNAGDVHRVEHIRDEDDELLQFAIQQSLLENGSENDQVTVWEALTNRRPSDTSPNQPNQTVPPSAYISYEERQLQRAIEASLHDTAAAAAAAPAATSVRSSDSDVVDISNGNTSENSESECSDDQLRIAMAMSQREADGAAARHKQEQAELELIIQLSLTEK